MEFQTQCMQMKMQTYWKNLRAEDECPLPSLPDLSLSFRDDFDELEVFAVRDELPEDLCRLDSWGSSSDSGSAPG